MPDGLESALTLWQFRKLIADRVRELLDESPLPAKHGLHNVVVQFSVEETERFEELEMRYDGPIVSFGLPSLYRRKAKIEYFCEETCVRLKDVWPRPIGVLEVWEK